MVLVAATSRPEVAAISSGLAAAEGCGEQGWTLGHHNISCAQAHVCSQHHNRLGLEERGKGESLAKKQEEDPDLQMPMELPGTAHSAKPLLIPHSRL